MKYASKYVVMLLCGLDNVRLHALLLQYTWDKKMETWVKSSGMLGGNGKVSLGAKARGDAGIMPCFTIVTYCGV